MKKSKKNTKPVCKKCKKEFYYGNYFPDTKEYICTECWMAEDTTQKAQN